MSGSQVGFLELGIQIVISSGHGCHVTRLSFDATPFAITKYTFLLSISVGSCHDLLQEQNSFIVSFVEQI